MDTDIRWLSYSVPFQRLICQAKEIGELKLNKTVFIYHKNLQTCFLFFVIFLRAEYRTSSLRSLLHAVDVTRDSRKLVEGNEESGYEIAQTPLDGLPLAHAAC